MRKALLLLLLLPMTILFATVKPIVIDTDASTDDAIAILYLLNQKSIDVKAIIVDKNGASTANAAPGHIGYILKLAKQTQIPVYLGLNKKSKYKNVYPAQAQALIDGSFKHKASIKHLVKRTELINIINQQSVDILSLGSLTNIADILPSIKQHINHITIMGGAVNVPGNLDAFISNTQNKYAEWNIYVDPDAFKNTLSSGLPITLISLDSTDKAILTEAFMEKLLTHKIYPEADFVYNMLLQSNSYINDGQYDFWDPLAAYAVVNAVPTTTKKINVVTTPGRHLGQLYQDKNGWPIQIVTGVNVHQLETALIKALTQ